MKGFFRHNAIILIAAILPLIAAPAFPQGSDALGPRVNALFFGDVDFREQEDEGNDGFRHAVGVAQLNLILGQRFTIFTEATLAKGKNKDTRSEIERFSLHYAFSDQYKLSAGRYHTPVGYWNSAYHHGSWLQTTVARPNTMKFGSNVVPIHFIGALLEGNVGDSDFGYKVGVGDGRSETINDPGDFINSENNGDTALLLAGNYRPLGRHRLNAGISVYVDKISPETGPDIDEKLMGAYLVLEGEAPEVLIEYIYSNHESSGSEGDVNSVYGQLAYRLPGKAHNFKPYFRAEKLEIDDSDPLLGGLGLDYEGVIAGTRWDFSSYMVLKAEVRHEKFDNRDSQNSLWLQLAFVFDANSAWESYRVRQSALNKDT